MSVARPVASRSRARTTLAAIAACLVAWCVRADDLTPEARRLLEQAAELSRVHDGHAVLVMHDGRVIFERYEGGWNADTPHPLASGTKSFTGVAAMLAAQKGLLSLDERVSGVITEWKDDPRRSRITVRQLLDLSSGLQPDSPEGRARVRAAAGRGDAADRLRAMRAGRDDFFAQGVAAPAEREPGVRFDYGANHYHAFGEFLERRLKERGVQPSTVWEWYTANIFDPIGLVVGRIGRDKVGQPQLAGGASLTAREWAKFGELVRLGGAWPKPDGGMRQVVETAWLDRCFERSAANPSYGLTWWLPSQGDPPPVRMAAGLGRQRLYVVPQARLVVVRFGDLRSERRGFEDAAFLAPILRAVGSTPIAVRTPEPALSAISPPEATTPVADADMRLVFEDDFEVAGRPDPAKWGHEVGFVRNRELQWYRPESARCEDGLLVIEATRERVPNPGFVESSADWRVGRAHADYASASLVTKGRFEFTYGRVRMRARIDTRAGLWPALWTKGTRQAWPVCGEIDIMECFAGLVITNAIWAGTKPDATQSSATRTPLDVLAKESGFSDVAAWSAAFHEWQLDWNASRLEFRLDGRRLGTVDLTKTVNATPDQANPFHGPHALIVNLAVGGASGGDPSGTAFPARFEVDWIRVWQHEADAVRDGRGVDRVRPEERSPAGPGTEPTGP
jgi:CubicO group peptidase (beta-lactamase class C family)